MRGGGLTLCRPGHPIRGALQWHRYSNLFPSTYAQRLYSGVAVNRSPTLHPSNNESNVNFRQRHPARTSTHSVVPCLDLRASNERSPFGASGFLDTTLSLRFVKQTLQYILPSQRPSISDVTRDPASVGNPTGVGISPWLSRPTPSTRSISSNHSKWKRQFHISLPWCRHSTDPT